MKFVHDAIVTLLAIFTWGVKYLCHVEEKFYRVNIYIRLATAKPTYLNDSVEFLHGYHVIFGTPDI